MMGNKPTQSEKSDSSVPSKRGWLKNGNPPGDFSKAPRCGAKTRKGTPCKSPCVRGKKRCRMHGGARGSGAPQGNKNAFKHGFYSQEEMMERRIASMDFDDILAFLQELKKNQAQRKARGAS